MFQAYQDTLQTQWSWLLQITKCIDTHLKENAAYSQVTSPKPTHRFIKVWWCCYSWRLNVSMNVPVFSISSSKRPTRPTVLCRRNTRRCGRGSYVTRTRLWRTFWKSSKDWRYSTFKSLQLIIYFSTVSQTGVCVPLWLPLVCGFRI